MEKKAKDLVIEADQLIEPLDSLYFDLVKTSQETSQQISALSNTINSIPELKTYMTEHKIEKPQPEGPLWKRVTVKLFSNILDLATAIVNAFINLIHTAYSYLIAPIINTFSKDVELKMQVLEEEKA